MITNTVYAVTVLGAIEHSVIAAYRNHLESFWMLCWVAVFSSYIAIAFVPVYDSCRNGAVRRNAVPYAGLFGVVVTILMTTMLMSAGFGWRVAWAASLVAYFAGALVMLLVEYAQLCEWCVRYRRDDVIGGGM